ncbi:hypothetical protein DK28_0206060 [Peptococcaceae bacterium SCADC1_2_3]|nr:hypothetical protein DK28_0206060 [Peptococcaceae bacterium SCADC1_2_3]KFI34553.1 hypothetical protein HY00_11500 [Peptococcaceae bacterium SCADC1_2_3]
MTKKMSKKMLISLMVAIMLIGVLATSVYAASQTVYIHQGDGPVQSAAISANNGANYYGWNYDTSGHKLYVDLQTSTGGGWSTDKSSLMDIGSSASGYSTLSGTRLWRVQLNPQWAYTDCDGKGTVSNR